ncbi:hypothetical protein FNV43_RR16980 [Rhamnella rubrinervis]|uniref:Uncharacterized protein n=1 Tax=Rhamnella rubrinervis TaxID=2594499 RepID=A0A8K0MCX7_9ROSA|nr:hypothetical protein FNV43_RR16980 [Rhamnella rubrinervis]
MGQQISTFSHVLRKWSYDQLEMPLPKRPSLSPELTLSQSDIVAKLDQAEVETGNSFAKPRQRPGKEVMVQGKPSHPMTAPTLASSSRVECKEIGASEESLH